MHLSVPEFFTAFSSHGPYYTKQLFWFVSNEYSSASVDFKDLWMTLM